MNRIKNTDKYSVYIEGYFKKNESDILYDIDGMSYKYPKKSKNWKSLIYFIKRLNHIEQNLYNKKYYKTITNHIQNKCVICCENIDPKCYVLKDSISINKDNIHSFFNSEKQCLNKINNLKLKGKIYEGYCNNKNKIVWPGGLKHYILKHKYKPSDEFINIININTLSINKSKHAIKIPSSIYRNNKNNINENVEYLKIDRNQFLIMDALMDIGGHKIFIDVNKNNEELQNDIKRYSEQKGALKFSRNNLLGTIIISADTNRIDDNDPDIFLPNDSSESYDYEFIFHTHPPTPYPGARVNEGILYELPSSGDILHFMIHYNEGLMQGSLIITPEGLYIIRKYNNNNNYNKMYDLSKISDMAKDIDKIISITNKDAISKYGTNITNDLFYGKILNDTCFIDNFNSKLNEKYGIEVLYYPRKKSDNNKWYIDTLYLQIYI